MYRGSAISFPKDKLCLGRWLGPTLDKGPAMSGKILKPNGERVIVSTYRPLTAEEYDDPVIKQRMDDFNEEVHIKLGPSANPDDFDVELEEFLEDFETPTYKAYSDKDNKAHIIPDRDDSQSFDQ